MKPTLVRLIAGAALVPLAACAASNATTPSEPPVGDIPTVTTAAQLTFPLDTYLLTGKEQVLVRRAVWRLVRDCIDRFGGTYTLDEAHAVDDLMVTDNPNARRYGVFDAEGAATRGYNAPPEYRRPNQRKAGWDPSAAEELLARGAAPRSADQSGSTTGGTRPTDRNGKPLPEDGCEGEAGRVLVDNAPAPGNADLATQLAVKANKQAQADSRVRDAMGRWRECMKGRGYAYADVWAPNDKDWPEPPADDEIATATADVACKVETNLLGVWLATESAYQKVLIDENAEALAAIQRDTRARAANAARLVGGG